MKEYGVTIPIAGCIYVSVEAESEEEAIEKAFNVDWNINLQSDGLVTLEEVDSYYKMHEGKVVFYPCSEVEAEVLS